MDFPDIKEFEDAPIQFHSEELDFDLPNQEQLSLWIEKTIEQEQKMLQSINFIFCNDAYLHKINLEYLDHDTLTDIITFPYSEEHIESDIYISVERVKENAQKFNVPFEKELKRVIIHGVLHLCGYKDKEEAEQKLMREKENYYIEKY
jgi:rRNA maturation RNase YbeY